MTLKKWLRARKNPHNFTSIHLKNSIERLGWQVGDFSYGRPIVFDWDKKQKLSIGRFCSIADGVKIYLAGNHRTNWATTYPFSDFHFLWPQSKDKQSTLTSNGDVRIGHDVWIGNDVTILSGITVGHGAVIGAGAMVSKDVPPFAIVAGNPARIVRMRFDDATIQKLLELAWWDLPNEAVAQLAPLLQSDNIEAMLEFGFTLKKGL